MIKLLVVSLVLVVNSGYAMTVCSTYTNQSTGQSTVLCTGGDDSND